jgi:hypothetical protein
MAMDMGNPLNATFNPDGTVLDAAGNPDNTGTAIQLESVGDTTPPVLTITTPTSTSSMNNTTLLEYNLTENLASGTLKIFYGNLITIGGLPTNSPARAATLHGSWVLDAAARTKGNGKTINLSAVGIPNFENGIIYNFTIEGVDGANNPVVSNVDNVTADLSIPTAPAVGDLRFQNFNGQVICEAEGSIGNTGDKLRFYVNGSFIQEAAYLGPYGELSETTVITGIPTQPAGGIIGYTLIDMAGNESAQSPAGIIPYAPDATDISLLQLSVSISEFTVTANAPGILSQGLMTLGIVFSTDYTNVITTGSTIADGTYTAFSDSIYASDFVAGDVVRYVYIDSFNNCSDWSADDGAIPALDTVTPVLGVANGNINDADSGEAISLNFTRDVTIDVIITTANISTGNTVIINNPYSWAGVLNDINIAPVGVADTSLGTAESLSINTGTGLSHVINLASYYFTPATGTIRVELNPMGTNLIRDTVGGHCTIPSSIISAGGITNGIEATGF